MTEKTQYYGTGRRKTAKARVFMTMGSESEITVNGKAIGDYFSRKVAQTIVCQPLAVTELQGKFNVKVTVTGGGSFGQAQAIRHGMARALLEYDEELKPTLRKAGFVTRDSRKVERKKFGLHKARKASQYSKR